MLGSWVRAPASSPDDCRNAVVFFLFVVQLRCFSKENIRDCMQASIRYSLYRDMHSISTTNKNGQLVAALLWGYLGRVFPHRASATFGTPSVTAKAVRAPRRWCNCVVSVKRIFVIVCKHPYDIPFTEICIAYPPQTKTVNSLQLYCGVTSVVYSRTAQAQRSALPR